MTEPGAMAWAVAVVVVAAVWVVAKVLPVILSIFGGFLDGGEDDEG